MIFLISLALAALFIRCCAKPLKQKPVPFYIGAVVISLAVLGCTVGGVAFPSWFQNWIWPLFSRSAFATALWAAVMWAGALPNSSRAIKVLMPVRGELSIIACILTLGHNAAYGRTYFRFLFTQPSRLPASQLAAAVCSLVMICIMLPLFVTSFKSVRRKMSGRSWKRLQRLAYGFYALLYIHIMLLTIPLALAGRSGYLLNALVYSVVFLGYGLCRVLKAQTMKSHRTEKLSRRQLEALAGALALSLCLTGGLKLSIPAEAAPVQQEEQSQPEEDPQPETPETPETPEMPEEESAPQEEAAAPEESPEPSEDEQQAEAPAEAAPAQTSAPAEASSQPEIPVPAESSVPASAPAPEPAPEPEPAPAPEPEPVRVYQNGTFSGTGEGFEGPITVSVTIQDDKITAITVTSASDDEPYFSEGKAVINRILSAQSANVDTVSGATFSSGGIIDGVKAALSSAKN